jgi:BirA family biotin operon repressor/biotin-[acetyl-CoA-carboxylase] ligase
VIVLARAGAEEGLWLRAEAQSSGRGRQGRDWASPPGNLYASTLVRLRPSDPPPATLALVAAVALDAAVRIWLDDRAPLRIKWPNDLLIGTAKLSGILLERSEDAVVIGFGVNLAHHPDLPDRLTTSLAAHGAAVSAGDFLETLAESVSRWLDKWRGEGLVPVRSRWMERAHLPGTALDVRLPDGSTQHGLFDRLDADGALILRLADGTTRVIHAADVFLL